jgi:hypothetical protein
MTIDLEQRYIAARGAVVDDISLFLAGQNEEDTQAFLQRWNDTLEADIHMTPPTDKSLFIWKLIESTMARVRQIELCSVRSVRIN